MEPCRPWPQPASSVVCSRCRLAVWTWPGLASFSQVSSSAWLALAILGLFITPLGWAFQNLSLRRFDASQVATFSNGSPFLTVVWGIWLFGELLTPALVVGGALTLGGIYWASGPRRSRAPGFRREQGRINIVNNTSEVLISPTATVEERSCRLR